MKLGMHCVPNKKQSWRVTITVLDREDFPTKDIFQDHLNYPTSCNYSLFPGNCNYITNMLPNKRSALHWAREQVDQLQTYLQDWRNPPENETKTLYI